MQCEQAVDMGRILSGRRYYETFDVPKLNVPNFNQERLTCAVFINLLLSVSR